MKSQIEMIHNIRDSQMTHNINDHRILSCHYDQISDHWCIDHLRKYRFRQNDKICNYVQGNIRHISYILNIYNYKLKTSNYIIKIL